VFLVAVLVVVVAREVTARMVLLVLPMAAPVVMEEVLVHIQPMEEGEIPVVAHLVEVTRVAVVMVLVD
jgi:hypothetical protein